MIIKGQVEDISCRQLVVRKLLKVLLLIQALLFTRRLASWRYEGISVLTFHRSDDGGGRKEGFCQMPPL